MGGEQKFRRVTQNEILMALAEVFRDVLENPRAEEWDEGATRLIERTQEALGRIVTIHGCTLVIDTERGGLLAERVPQRRRDKGPE